MVDNDKGFLFLYEWIDEMKELDGETFKRILFALSDYFKTQDKKVLNNFKGVEKAYILNLIRQSEQAGA